MLNEAYDDAPPKYIPTQKVLNGLVFYLTNMAYPDYTGDQEGEAYDRIANFIRKHPYHVITSEDLLPTLLRLGFNREEAEQRATVLSQKYRDYHDHIVR